MSADRVCRSQLKLCTLALSEKAVVPASVDWLGPDFRAGFLKLYLRCPNRDALAVCPVPVSPAKKDTALQIT